MTGWTPPRARSAAMRCWWCKKAVPIAGMPQFAQAPHCDVHDYNIGFLRP